MLDILEDFRGSAELSSTTVCLLQEIICEPGLFHEESEHWQIVLGKTEGEFRGEAIAHLSAPFSHHDSLCIPGAVATTLKLRQTSVAFRTLAGHIPHHATIPATEDMLLTWRRALTPYPRVLVGIDANETFTTPLTNTAGGVAQTGRGDSVLHWAAQCTLTLPPQELHTPTHFPYNQQMRPRRLDYIFTKGTTAAKGQVIQCKDRASSDHDGVALSTTTHKGGGATRSTWGPRRLRPPEPVARLLEVPAPKGEDPHRVLATISKAITVPGGTHNRFQESHELKQLRHHAQKSAPGEASKTMWKQVARLRKRERRLWDKQQALQAANLDWKAMRSLQRTRTHRGWHLQLQDAEHWQQQLGEHFRSIFAKPQLTQNSSRVAELRRQLRMKCKTTPWTPFTAKELLHTSAAWANNKSTGPDGISHEAPKRSWRTAFGKTGCSTHSMTSLPKSRREWTKDYGSLTQDSHSIGVGGHPPDHA